MRIYVARILTVLPWAFGYWLVMASAAMYEVISGERV